MRQVPCVSQRRDALAGIFDDIQYEAEVHNLSGYGWAVGSVSRVPSVGRDVEFSEVVQIGSPAAAVVEDNAVSGNDGVVEGGGEWPRQRTAGDCGAVPGNRSCHAAVGSTA